MKAEPPLVALTLLCLYIIFFVAGLASDRPSWASRCKCSEPTLSVKEGLAAADVKGVAECVLHDHPTRSEMHARLARCLGRSAWQIPGRPAVVREPAQWDDFGGSESSKSWDDGTTGYSSSWSDSSSSDEAGDDSTDEAADDALADRSGLGSDSSSELAANEEEGVVAEDEEGLEEEAAAASAAEVTRTSESLSPEERAAKMLDAIRDDEAEAEQEVVAATAVVAQEPVVLVWGAVA